MKTLYSALFLSFLLVACGGSSNGSDSKSTTPPIPVNSPPVISSQISLSDASNNGKIETSESFIVQVKVTDSDNDKISGSVQVDGSFVELSTYVGESDFTHQASLSIDTKGERTATIAVTDSNGSEVTLEYIIAVYPRDSEVQDVLISDVVDFVSGGQIDELKLLGWSTDEQERTLGYLSSDLTEDIIDYNAMPYGECGVDRPHKLLKVEVSPNETVIPEAGVIFPLECLHRNQLAKIKQRMKSTLIRDKVEQSSENYVSQNFLISQYDDGEIVIAQTGEGIRLEGHVNSIHCGEFNLINESGSYMLTSDKVLDNLVKLTNENKSFELSCERVVDYQGQNQKATLLATITGKLVEIDNTSPTGSIDKVYFSIPYLSGGLDAGSVCVTTSASDDNGVAEEVLSLESEDGLTDSYSMSYDAITKQFCGALSGFDGNIYFKQAIVDYAGNLIENISDTYIVEKNDAPTFSSQLPTTITLRKNQGTVILIEADDISDPEGHEVILSGDTSISTEQSLGKYTVTAIATDQYGAESSKTITVTLADNTAPNARIKIIGNRSGEAWFYNGKVRDDNVYVVLGLTSNDPDGQVVSSTLHGDLVGDGRFVEIKNYDSTYDAGVLFVGGETLTFRYQVTDNEGKESSIATLSFDVHKNQPPIYQGQTDFTITTGSCITIDKNASDPENDSIIHYSIVDDDWEPCFNTAGEYSLRIYMYDEYGLGDETFINVKVED